MRHLLQWFNNLPIGRKLLLTSVAPVLAVVLLSVVTYRSVQTFSEEEDQLNNIYLVQKRAAEYMSLVVDLETGFRGYVLTRQEPYLQPYLLARDHIQVVGDSLQQMVRDRQSQYELIRQAQAQVRRLMEDKDGLINTIKAGRPMNALTYIEEGRGRAIMVTLREEMDQFARLEQARLNDTLARIAQDRSTMISVILGGGILAMSLMALALHLIAGSITTPLAGLAKAVRSVQGGTIPSLPALERRDEIGDLIRLMNVMNAQIRDHITQVERSEAELRIANQSLASSESHYRSIVDHAPFGIFRTNGMALVFSNRYNRILAGLNPDEEGDPEAIRQSIHPEDRERVLTEFSRAVEHHRPYATVFRFLHKDGTVTKVLSRRIPISDAAAKTTMYQGFNIDITALDEMQSRLNRAERLATLGQMAAGIAHEIRNPLVGIGSTAKLLLEDFEATDARRPDLMVILDETRRLDRIVNQIVDYARPRVLVPLLFAVDDVVQETLSLLEGTVTNKRIRVRHTASHLSRIEADRDHIKQVLLNLMQNALDALEEQGALGITASESTRNDEPGMMIHITDNGIGIGQENLPYIFEPFFTTGKTKGTGLGLAICRNIIDAHRGDITVVSELGQGTTVRLWLPLQQREAVET